jgi:hypothetical protein
MTWKNLFALRVGYEVVRATATYLLMGFYAFMGVITSALAYTGAAWGYYFRFFVRAYATLIIGLNYAKARRGKHRLRPLVFIHPTLQVA